ncbi:hypothetical protein [Pseudomonas synxantha]|uniref:Uncharacterized protein n=1 Tax=Pseudomonas synxantha TaxID=47883 RepID=A0ACC6JMF9_9PSED|nr:hypothetical protein [Pseudomonas synxantha]MDR6607441.1 hypothetical protein [Pseudomonas synxantha]
MANPIHRLAEQLKAIVFINQLILLAKCGRNPSALERWGEAFEVRVGLVRPGGGYTNKWKKYLQGVMPEPKLQTALIAEFPMLKQVLDNPLWEVLRLLEVSSDHGRTLVNQLRLHGKPLHGLQRPRLQRRITAAYWQDLGFWLVILAGAVEKYRWAREFMRERFFVYLYLICVQPEFTGAQKWLYPLLDYHFREGHLPSIAWPVSAGAFDIQLRGFRVLPRWLMKKGGIQGVLELGFFCEDPEGFEAVSYGYGLYWDADWNRRVLTSKEMRYLSPTLQISLEGIQTGDKDREKRAA